jgi:hypothetical protein
MGSQSPTYHLVAERPPTGIRRLWVRPGEVAAQLAFLAVLRGSRSAVRSTV